MSLTIFEALGFEGNPFAPEARVERPFRSDNLDRIVDELVYAVNEHKGVVVLTGKVGSGKTSLLHRLLKSFDYTTTLVCSVLNPLVSKDELMKAVARGFFLPVPEEATYAEIFDALQLYLIDQSTRGINCVVVVDEAHHVSPEGLEALRLLGDPETVDGKLLQILLVGDPILLETLDLPEMQQLRSRIATVEHIKPFTRNETERYINTKLGTASTNLVLQPADADTVHIASGGNPRQINRIMERVLYAVVAYGKGNPDGDCVGEALEEVAATQPEVAGRLAGKRKQRRLAYAAAAMAVLMVVLSPLMPGKGERESIFSVVMRQYMQQHVPQGTLRGEGALPESASAQDDDGASASAYAGRAFVVGKNYVGKDFSASAGEFLEPHGFGDAHELLAEAVTTGDERVLERRIPSGYRLLTMDRLPVGANVTFTAFPWRHFSGEGPFWLVLWKPEYSFEEIYPGLSGDGVAAMQLRLQSLGMYEREIDGVLGPETLSAVSAFQGGLGLPRTMTPDPMTLFWLFSLG